MIANCGGCGITYGRDDCNSVGYDDLGIFYCSSDCLNNSDCDSFICMFCGEIEAEDISPDGEHTNKNVFGNKICCNDCLRYIKAGEELSYSIFKDECYHCYKDLKFNKSFDVVFLSKSKTEIHFKYCNKECFLNSNILLKSEGKNVLNTNNLESNDPLLNDFIGSLLIKPKENLDNESSYIEFLIKNDNAFLKNNSDKRTSILKKYNYLNSLDTYGKLRMTRYKPEMLGNFSYFIKVPNKDFIVIFNLSTVILLKSNNEYKVICDLNSGDRKELLKLIESLNIPMLDIFNVVNDNRRSADLFLKKFN